jgi:hypothetical protein
LTGKPLKICHLQYCTIFYYVYIYIHNIHIIYVIYIYIYVYYTHIWIWHCKWWIPKKRVDHPKFWQPCFRLVTAGLQGILSSPCNEWRGFTLQPPEILGHNAGKGQISYHQLAIWVSSTILQLDSRMLKKRYQHTIEFGGSPFWPLST